ncbi:MAG: hypothetical protein AAGG50_02320 [Bacteroidota bacterium]
MGSDLRFPIPDFPFPMLRPLDDSARAWVAVTLDRLTLSERVGQLLMPWLLGGYTARDSKAFDRVARWV